MRMIVLLALLAGCEGFTLPTALGGQCELTSECDAPLVCRLGLCRKECQTSRDCAAGLHCWLDNEGLGSCELPAELGCSLDSECPEILVCNPLTESCTNECGCAVDGPCEDCPPGADCITDPATSNRRCVDNSICAYASDCESGEVCLDGFCRPQCNDASDCLRDEMCVTLSFVDEPDRGTTNACRCELTIEVQRYDLENPSAMYEVCE